MRPPAPHGFEYVTLGVPDLDEVREFLEYHVGLVPVERDEARLTMRADVEHHCVDLRARPDLSEAEVIALGFSVGSADALDDLKRRVDDAGRDVIPLDDLAKDVCTGGFATVDPSGVRLELVDEFHVWAEPPMVELRPLDIVHPFIATPHFDESLAFYTDALGFLASDYIANQTAFLRGEDRYHHSLALRRSDTVSVDHIAFAMKSFDHVMRAHGRARYRGVNVTSDIVNHSASRSIAFYMHEPRIGPPIELCDGHHVLTPEEHETNRPRRMSLDPRNIDVWRAAADDWGLR